MTYSHGEKVEHHMRNEQKENTRQYRVVINHEEQYSIWFADREQSLGWKDVGKSGTKEECLGYINEVWKDMSPLSLRKPHEVIWDIVSRMNL